MKSAKSRRSRRDATILRETIMAGRALARCARGLGIVCEKILIMLTTRVWPREGRARGPPGCYLEPCVQIIQFLAGNLALLFLGLSSHHIRLYISRPLDLWLYSYIVYYI